MQCLPAMTATGREVQSLLGFEEELQREGNKTRGQTSMHEETLWNDKIGNKTKQPHIEQIGLRQITLSCKRMLTTLTRK